MKCLECPNFSSAPLWNKCGITGTEYFMPVDEDCPYVDENGKDNGRFKEEMDEYERIMQEEMQKNFDENGDPLRDFLGNPW